MDHKDQNHSKSVHHEEITSKNPADEDLTLPATENEPLSVQWYVEPMTFDTMHEAYEWISSGAYNEIGYLYTGYQTSDAKLAHVLLYELVRVHTQNHPRYQQIFADYEFTDNGLLYKVWLIPLPYDN